MATSDISAHVWSAAIIAAMFCGATVFSHAAMAQPDTAAAPAESEEITVIAPEVVRKVVGRAGPHRQEVVLLSMTTQVNYADLDLSRPEDPRS